MCLFIHVFYFFYLFFLFNNLWFWCAPLEPGMKNPQVVPLVQRGGTEHLHPSCTWGSQSRVHRLCVARGGHQGIAVIKTKMMCLLK